MQAFSLGQVNVPGQRNYVFVDEHNRHKRLKVMRACEGCRRRKIKCDAATTNSWPCSACNRLKLQCVPPTPFDQDVAASEPEPAEGGAYRFVNAMDLHQPMSQRLMVDPTVPLPDGLFQPSPAQRFPDARAAYDPPLMAPPSGRLDPLPVAPDAPPFHLPDSPPAERPSNSPSDPGSYTVEGLSDAFGILKVDEIGIAPYLQRPSKFNAEPAAPLPEQEVDLPPLDARSGRQIQIPPTLMPSEQEASAHFKTFFSEIHPYVPVVVRSHFRQQWMADRQSISPLLLEAMLACAGRYSSNPGQGARWLALANKHEDSFLDTPRLSTIQALLLLLKAREAAPKQGYYYRSWMMCKTIASMAKDLDLHQHHHLHVAGQACASTRAECLTKTRVWQTLMVCETMIGGPQGRYDYEVDLDTVDLSESPPGSDLDAFEAHISRQSSYFIRNVGNIRAIAEAYHALKQSKDWAIHPTFVAKQKGFDSWSDTLPADLQVTLPADGSGPTLRSHFIGNMHTHYHLGRIILQRPQLMACKSPGADREWKQQMTRCYSSAQILCRIQEAELDQFGLDGLLCMQRGINFTIYTILTCVMLHLIAVTSPDPDLHTHARDYFTRHMAILEQCMNAWPMEEMKAQIDALREAFSADKDKPFELKASFPYGTPSDTYAASPPLGSQPSQAAEEDRVEPPAPAPAPAPAPRPGRTEPAMTPPMSRGCGLESRHLPPTDAGLVTVSYDPSPPMTSYAAVYPAAASGGVDEIAWNPAPILANWNEAFSIPPAALAPPPPPAVNATASSLPLAMLQQPHPSMHPLSPPHPTPYSMSGFPAPPNLPLTSLPAQHQPQQQQYPPAPPGSAEFAAPLVSPRRWQQSVANVVDPHGHKRRWIYSELEQQAAKRSR